MIKIETFECDFSNPAHNQKLVDLMNEYIMDEMGGGMPITGGKVTDLIEGLKSHPSKFILFASVENEIVGLTNCFINFGTFAAKPFINIHDIIVSKKHRGKGIGRKLMESIVKKANEIGSAKITLEVREDNKAAQELYKSLGFGDIVPRMFFWAKYL